MFDHAFPAIDPATLKSWLHDGQELALLDVREAGQFGEDHLFYAIPLPYSVLEAEIERLAPRKSVRVVVYGDATTQGVVQRCAAALSALGYTACHVLQGGIEAWKAAGFTTFAGVNLPSKTFGELAEHAWHTPRVTAQQLHAWMQEPDRRFVVLDGRPVDEFRKMSIPGAICCPNGELALRIQELVPDAETAIVINCAGRTRSIIGAQTLINLGIPNPVYALENGTQGWYLADFALEHGADRRYPVEISPASLQQARARANLVRERFDIPSVDAATLAGWLAGDQYSVFVCDVRTREEFERAALPPVVQHTPGGQLIQATDQYAGVRGGRIVLCDFDAIRAPVVASWLKQLGWSVFLLSQTDADTLAALPQPKRSQPVGGSVPPLPAPAVVELLNEGATLVDLRQSMQYRAGHVQGALWAVRPMLDTVLPVALDNPVILLGTDIQRLAWVARDLTRRGFRRVYICTESLGALRDAGCLIEATPDTPPDAQCIDYLFFVHDRHDGNKDAARQYLAWETGLVAQLDAQERAGFVLPVQA